MNRLLNRLTDKPQAINLVYGLLLCMCCFTFLRGFTSFYPLDYGDESLYLLYGTKFFGQAPPDLGAPLYFLVYRFLHYFVSDPIQLFYVVFGSLVCLLTLLQFTLCRRFGMTPLYSFLCAFFTLISLKNAPVLVKVNHFNFICFLAAIYFASLLKNYDKALGLLSVVSLVLIFLRQDNIILTFGFASLLLWRLLKVLKWIQASLIVVGLLLAYGLLNWALGNPFPHERSWETFIDHFYLNSMAKIGGLPVTQKDFIESTFRSAHDVPHAIIANAHAFLVYAKGNLISFCKVFPAALFQQFPISFLGLKAPLPFETASRIESFAVILLLILLSCIYSLRTKSFRRSCRPAIFGLFCFFIFLCFLKSILISALFEANPRYSLEFHFATLLLFFAILDFSSGEKKAKLYLVIPFFLWLGCPDHRDAHQYSYVREASNPPDDSLRQVSLFLRTIDSSPSSKWLCFGVYDAYDFRVSPCIDPLNYLSVRPLYRNYGDYLTKENFNLIILDDPVKFNFIRWYGRPELEQLTEFISRSGMKRIFEWGSASVFVKENPT